MRIINLKNIRKMNLTPVEWLQVQIKNCPTAENLMNNIDGFLNEAKLMEKHKAFSQHDVIKNEVAVCLITDEQQKCSYRSEGKCLYKNACAHKQTVL